MANCAYAGVWIRNVSRESLPSIWLPFLDVAPFSEASPGFSGLIVRAVDPSYPPVLDLDFRGQPVTAAELVELASDHLQPDAALEAQCFWDLWVCEWPEVRWSLKPQRLEIVCCGEEYDGGVFAQTGHVSANLGFEHLFTGHAGLLASRGAPQAAPQDSVEAEFLDTMAQPERLHEYHERTRENGQRLRHWMHRLHSLNGVQRVLLWSEGEENFEARLDDIAALR